MSKESEIRILQLSDIHGADFLIEEIGEDLEQADLVVLSGDITHFGHAGAAENIISKISRFNDQILAVSGNCDYSDVDEYLEECGIGLHRRIREKMTLKWAGISGSLPCPGTTPNEYTETELEQWFEELAVSIPKNPDLLVVHQPPFETLSDQLPNGQHVGSKVLRRFIEQFSPLACLTAHIHEGMGIDRIGSSLIVSPGPFRTGKYAIITISGEKSVNASLKQITV